MPDPLPVCVCGHDEGFHQHYRQASDTDCSICGPLICRGFRADRPAISPELRRALLVIVGVPALVTACVLAAIHLGPGAVALLLVPLAVLGVLLIAPKKED